MSRSTPQRLRRKAFPVSAALLLATSLLGGCGHSVGYPSLARRPAELIGLDGTVTAPCAHGRERHAATACPPGDGAARVTGSSAVVAPGRVIGPSTGTANGSALAGRIDALVSEARAGHAQFASRQAATEALVMAAGSAEPGSDAWARATELLSDLDSAHALTTTPLAELDRMDIDDRLAHADDDPNGTLARGDAAAIRAATATVAQIVADDVAVLDALKGRLRH